MGWASGVSQVLYIQRQGTHVAWKMRFLRSEWLPAIQASPTLLSPNPKEGGAVKDQQGYTEQCHSDRTQPKGLSRDPWLWHKLEEVRFWEEQTFSVFFFSSVTLLGLCRNLISTWTTSFSQACSLYSSISQGWREKWWLPQFQLRRPNLGSLSHLPPMTFSSLDATPSPHIIHLLYLVFLVSDL